MKTESSFKVGLTGIEDSENPKPWLRITYVVLYYGTCIGLVFILKVIAIPAFGIPYLARFFTKSVPSRSP